MTINEILSTALVLIDGAIVVVLVPRIVVQRRDSAATMAWVFLILLLPIGGAVSYHFLGTRRMRLRQIRRAQIKQALTPEQERLDAALVTFRPDDEDEPLAEIDRTEATVGNEVQVLQHGDLTFRSIEEAIRAATSYVHVEFYIFHPDATGMRLIDAMVERARAGVEVRLLVDAVGARDLRPKGAPPLIAAGGKFAEFLPVSLITRPFSVNFRNHRKIVVVDGKVGFIGGMNVGDEYRGRTEEFGNWRDTHVRLRGPAVLRLQEIFAEDWGFASGEYCVGDRYLPAPERPGSVVVDVVDSGPDRTAEKIYRRLFVAMTRSVERIWLTTPYFIPDRAILVALMTAAERGVDVRLLLPGWSDHPFVLYAGRSHYPELLEAGVKIYEYQRGMLHAKTMVVDDEWVTIGSANMDRRSFLLNWEANLIMVDQALAGRMAQRFLLDLEQCVLITTPFEKTAYERFRGGLCHLMSPLL